MTYGILVLYRLPVKRHFGVVFHAVFVLLDLMVIVSLERSDDKRSEKCDVFRSFDVEHETLVRIESVQSVTLSCD